MDPVVSKSLQKKWALSKGPRPFGSVCPYSSTPPRVEQGNRQPVAT